MKKAFNTIAEQIIYTACFFLTQAVLARSMPIEEFAKFSAFYSVVILLSIIHNCTITEPVLIFIAKDHKPTTRSLALAHFPSAIFVIASAYYISPDTSKVASLTYIATLLSFLIYWTNRSIAWQSGSIIKYSIPAILQAICITTLSLLGKATLENTLFTIAASLLIPLLIIKKNNKPEHPLNLLASIKFSSLNLGAQVALWTMTHGLVIYYLQINEPDNSSKLRILLTLILPAQYINIALSNYYLPILSKEPASSSNAIRFITISAAISSAYGIILFSTGEKLASILFGRNFTSIDASNYFILPIVLSAIQSTRTLLKSQQENLSIIISLSIGFVIFAILHLLTAQLEICAFIGLTSSATLLFLKTIHLINTHKERT
ncbi:hypothetical protein N5J43_24215 [Pseudomonas nicosulfuronedens]|uniref:hypothetical protein n=1 Tax=Pseudomonas nicosulfuronedens TaxID=2571105 RepID=UPI00244AEACF|nr:hypothetical protein [Pseudomonas nicosulfuronedens]MDH1007224.1 hypothetical protein [Pseudomonas nicosulfuronedens]MDH1982069.1 hypothetical protein [Pseudomonas nicosulfuronedens]MDH2026319.1 hypothetical protein [Pseudomonas nicosulfuronedens]